MIPLIVGESGPAATFKPNHSLGDQLRSILGLTVDEYTTGFDGINLCEGKWSLPVAQAFAIGLKAQEDQRVLILLGNRVAEAFELTYAAFTIQSDRFVILPYPTAANPIWSEHGAKLRARGVLTRAGCLPVILERK